MAKSDNSEAKRSLFAFEQKLRSLDEDGPEKQVEELSAMFQALWSLLRDRLQLSDEDLLESLNKVSEEKLSQDDSEAEPEPCPKCGRPVLAHKGHCVYCGADEETVSAALKRFS